MADRMIVMRDGEAMQIGAPLEVYENPRNRFVAEFIGSPSTNFLAPALVPDAPAEAASVGLRPEHTRITDDGALAAKVLHIEALGAETLVHTVLPDGTAMIVRQEGHLPKPEHGAEVRLGWAPERVMFFDAREQRI